MTRYNEEVRAALARQSAGKVIETLEYDVEGDYYTLVLVDGFEFSFRFVADL